MQSFGSGDRNRDTVVFLVMPGLAYGVRMVLALALVAAGLGLQAWMLAYLPGIVLVFLGNLLVLVKGYDNRVKLGGFEAEAGWSRVDEKQVAAVQILHKRMATWDRSALDITNGLGFVVLVLLAVTAGVLAFIGAGTQTRAYGLLAGNALMLLAPHWVTGVRRILTAPTLISKIAFFKDVLAACATEIKGWQLEYHMQLGGRGTRIPRDMKLRLVPPDRAETFLGLYAQVSTNTANGTAYPYFYTVLVGRKESGLRGLYNAYDPPVRVTKEYSVEGEVEVLVVRQTTTKTSGYHTRPADGARIMCEGLALGRRAVGAGKA